MGKKSLRLLFLCMTVIALLAIPIFYVLFNLDDPFMSDAGAREYLKVFAIVYISPVIIILIVIACFKPFIGGIITLALIPLFYFLVLKDGRRDLVSQLEVLTDAGFWVPCILSLLGGLSSLMWGYSRRIYNYSLVKQNKFH